MTEKKTTMTNAQALAAAHDLAGQAGMMELADKLAHMYEQATKKRTTPKAPTKEQLQTLAQIEFIVDKMRNENIEVVDTKWVMSHVDYVTSAQKATAIMRKGMKIGKFVKGEPNKGKVTYKLAEE